MLLLTGIFSNYVFAWETCCTVCNGQLLCNGQACSGLFQACGAVFPAGPGSCNFQWTCQTSTWRIVVFVICLIIGIGGFLICMYTGFRWLSYRKLTRTGNSLGQQRTPFVVGAASAPPRPYIQSYPRSYFYPTKVLYEPSAPPRCA